MRDVSGTVVPQPRRVLTAGLPVIVAFAASIVAAGCNPHTVDERDYATRVAASRAEKDLLFQRASDSPIPENRKAELLPLAYFPVDATFNVPALLKPATDTTVIYIPTSSGQPRAERRAGTLE